MKDQIFIDALTLDASIGVFEHEYTTTQRVRFDLIIELSEPEGGEYTMANIVRYDQVVQDIKDIIEAGHIELVETMAEKVADTVLSYDGVSQVEIKVSKLSAITEADGVGIKIKRQRIAS